MKIQSLTCFYSAKSAETKFNNKTTINQPLNENIAVLIPIYYKPTFGYCTPHMRMMKNVNEKFSDSIKSIFSEYEEASKKANAYNEKINSQKNAYKMAAQILAQYANYQYSMAEVIPSYAVESSAELMNAFSNNSIFNNPLDILITINNVQNLETETGIDKNTGKPYTPEQMRKSKANTQLYTTVLLLEMLDKNISSNNFSDENKEQILNLREIVLSSISSVYGPDAYARIQTLKKMGPNASIEEKRKSLELVREFDIKAKELNFGEDFSRKLSDLIEQINIKENRTNDSNTDIKTSVPKVVLKYHTHPHEAHNHDEHNYSHEYMHAHGIEHVHEHH